MSKRDEPTLAERLIEGGYAIIRHDVFYSDALPLGLTPAFAAYNVETTDRDYPAQLEGWQEPLRQMEG